MLQGELPTYAIVELLIRLAEINTSVGSYKGHSLHEHGVMVKTTNGYINFPYTLVKQQFQQPETIGKDELQAIAGFYHKQP